MYNLMPDRTLIIQRNLVLPPSRPIGPLVDASPAPRPEHITLQGRYVTLVPLSPVHSDALYPLSHGDNAHVWDYLFEGPFPDQASFAAHIAVKSASKDPLFFAILDKSGCAIGYATLMRIDTTHRVIEVGNILYTPALQRTPGATEAMYLLAKTIFELGYRRYEWKCNALNAPSRRAAARFGFTFEGIFRQHMIVKGRNRDTAWYSMLDAEWPAICHAYESWLNPDNFEAAGQQKISLSHLMEHKS
jgi:RimJ/RimL family protein N-acetyltransferase